MTYLHAKITADRGYAVAHEYLDERQTPFDLLIFQGLPHLTMNLRRTLDGRVWLTPCMAAELAHTLDHYSRHHTLPLRNTPEPEPLAYI